MLLHGRTTGTEARGAAMSKVKGKAVEAPDKPFTGKTETTEPPRADFGAIQGALSNYNDRMNGVGYRLLHIEKSLHGLHMSLSDNHEQIDWPGLIALLEILASYVGRESRLLDTMYCHLDRELKTDTMENLLEIYGQSERWESFDPLYGEWYEDDPFELFKRCQIPGGKP